MAAEPDSIQPQPERPEPPRLEFRPDAAKTSRIRVFRIVTLGTAAVVLGACMVWLIAFRPRNPVPAAVSYGELATETKDTQPPRPTPIASALADNPMNAVRNTVSGMESLLDDVKELWRRAASHLPLSTPGQGQFDEIVTRVRRAVVLAESAAAVAESGQDRLLELKEALRRAGVGGYRASELGSAADGLVRELRSCAADRLEYFRAREQAYAALASGDSAEFEIKGDVATGYLRKSESGERRVERARERMRVALAELERQ